MTTLQKRNLALCGVCKSITDRPMEPCVICGAPTFTRRPHSIQKVWAFLIAGMFAYIPGNLFPITITSSMNGDKLATVIGNIMMLIHHHSPVVALIIFLFSVVIPLSKFGIIAWLATGIQRGVNGTEKQRLHAYEMVEFVGRWSMVDVFVVTVLAALVHISGLLIIHPGVGIYAFALSVILTMLASTSLDSRLIWQEADNRGERNVVSG